ncbi:MAG: AAA family ATPase, partial [Eubacteriales bacterium]|nr:AAA family ATPase [Eubacteriales bacterium]
MGMFLNRGITEYESAVNSDIYIDKTDMIQIFSKAVNTEQRYICVSRPRRFGKTMTANMLAAYFEKGSDSRFLFEGRKLGKLPDWDKNLNRFDVIRIDLADLCSSNGSPEAALDFLEKSLKEEVDAAYPGIIRMETDTVTDALARVNDQTEAQFIIIIDEWDALFRDEKNNEFVQTRYINLLRALFKGNRSKKFTALAYITGILPIKKY